MDTADSERRVRLPYEAKIGQLFVGLTDWGNLEERIRTLALTDWSSLEPKDAIGLMSLACEDLTHRASEFAVRWRLMSPYLEHLSQAFARFFMRVGLPSSIPEFK